ncbi:MAG: hypothetical protein FJ095_03295 [Deltaproteobacteria bacterium]|nr:hypothetical protein [Deltaproteobacteria bacterium]
MRSNLVLTFGFQRTLGDRLRGSNHPLGSQHSAPTVPQRERVVPDSGP